MPHSRFVAEDYGQFVSAFISPASKTKQKFDRQTKMGGFLIDVAENQILAQSSSKGQSADGQREIRPMNAKNPGLKQALLLMWTLKHASYEV